MLLMLVLLPVADQTALPIRKAKKKQSVENREDAAAAAPPLEGHS
mgnify:CR=1 FL=1